MKKDKKIEPFKPGGKGLWAHTSSKKAALLAAKNLIYAALKLKEVENKGGPKFDFDKHAHHISSALALLTLEGEITSERSKGTMKFLAYKQRERSYT